MMIGGGGVGGFIRNLSRRPGYGLRGRRKEYAKSRMVPVGPKLVRGRGRPRARGLTPGVLLSLILLLIVIGGIAVWALRNLA